MKTQRSRPHLEATIDDPTAPATLKQALKQTLTRYDRAVDLNTAVSAERQRLNADLTAAQRNEPHRLMAMIAGKTKVTVDDVALGIDALTAAVTHAEQQAATMRRLIDLTWHNVERAPIDAALDDVLPWVAGHRIDTPWHEPLPAHIDHIWHLAGGAYLWHLPMVTKPRRITRLQTSGATETMRRVWHALGTDDIVLIDNTDTTRKYRVTAYWPDLATDEISAA